MKIEGVLGVAGLCYLTRNHSLSNGECSNSDVFLSVEDQTKIIELVISLRRKPSNPAGLFFLFILCRVLQTVQNQTRLNLLSGDFTKNSR